MSVDQKSPCLEPTDSQLKSGKRQAEGSFRFVVPGLRANRTLLPVAPTGVAIRLRSAGFGNRDRFELNGKIGLHRVAG
jgi:hypothetical protein